MPRKIHKVAKLIRLNWFRRLLATQRYCKQTMDILLDLVFVFFIAKMRD